MKEDQEVDEIMLFDSFESLNEKITGEKAEVEELPSTSTELETPGEVLGSSLKDNEVAEDTGVKDSEKPKTVDTKASDKYRQTLKKLFGDSISTITTEVDGVDVDVPIDELEIDEETYEILLEEGLKLEKAKANEDKISTKGASDFAKKLIEIERNGGNVSALLNNHKNYTEPLDRLDMSTKGGQKEAIYMLQKANGVDDKTAELIVSTFESTGVLEEKAEEAKEDLKGKIDVIVENERLNAIAKTEANRQRLKAYEKDLTTNLSIFELNDAAKKELVKFTTKPNEKGVCEIDNVYYETRHDPIKSAKLALFLRDMEEYDNQISKSKVNKSLLGTAGKIKVIKTAGMSASEKRKEEDSVDTFESMNAKLKIKQ